MKISIPFVRILNIQNMKETNGKIIGISLGKDAGFACIYWKYGKNTFDWANKLKKGDYIFVPSGELRTNKYVNNLGINITNVQIWTNYLELVIFPKKDKAKAEKEEIKEDKSVDEEINDAFSDFDNLQEKFDDNFEKTETIIEKNRKEEDELDNIINNYINKKEGD